LSVNGIKKGFSLSCYSQVETMDGDVNDGEALLLLLLLHGLFMVVTTSF